MDPNDRNENLYQLSKKLAWWEKKLENDPQITSANKRDIKRFLQEREDERISDSRRLIYLQKLPLAARLLGKDFRTATEDDLRALVRSLRARPGLSEGSVDIYRVTLRRFYKWLLGDNDAYPPQIKWWKAPRDSGHIKLRPEDLLTPEDIQAMTSYCRNARDRALLNVLYEGGFRIGEAASMRIDSVSFDELGARVRVVGKTGERTARLLKVQYLIEWLRQHPLRQNPDAPLWCSSCQCERLRGKPLSYASIRKQLADLAKRAGINKPVNPHALRHAAATRLVKLGVSREMRCRQMGWTLSSTMDNRYVHLNGDDLDSALSVAYGLKPPSNQEPRNARCSRCNAENPVSASYCGKCGIPIDFDTAVKLDVKQSKLEKAADTLIRLQKLLEKKPEVIALLESMAE
ncbi:hypothetical protein AUJ14_01275 [Candidatus Micrarchaeota archaeon CG1_02_55_22]|nr:MAG: hypothetical protein AUJ14_01275 [Candidatus Micrarchaeota archaeon CG1_02_55_22]